MLGMYVCIHMCVCVCSDFKDSDSEKRSVYLSLAGLQVYARYVCMRMCMHVYVYVCMCVCI